MQLPYGADMDDFERCKTIVSNFIDDKTKVDEITYKIMQISYATGGEYTEEMIINYVQSYIKCKD